MSAISKVNIQEEEALSSFLTIPLSLSSQNSSKHSVDNFGPLDVCIWETMNRVDPLLSIRLNVVRMQRRKTVRNLRKLIRNIFNFFIFPQYLIHVFSNRVSIPTGRLILHHVCFCQEACKTLFIIRVNYLLPYRFNHS